MTLPNKLFVLELANNHMGDLDHGLRVVNELAAVCAQFPFEYAIKLQYRQLDTFIHPDFQDRTDLKFVKRFSETRLTRDDTRRLVDGIRAAGFLPACTPFDEASVDLIEEDGFGLLKIASCSFTDWPLLERIARVDKPLVASTAGADLESIDNVVSFFRHRNKDLTLMHCVAEYPTRSERAQLGQIDLLRARYPELRIGFSTHEDPADTRMVQLAVAKGCAVFEKHVGVETETYAINGYSATPEQIRAWLAAAQDAFERCGSSSTREEIAPEERASLHALRRGAFARRDVAAGERLTGADVFFAMPTLEPDQVTANDWSKYRQYTATAPIGRNRPVRESDVDCVHVREQVYGIVQNVKRLLKEGNVVIPGAAELELSHHYGIEQFREVGTTMITVVNRDYCKKLIVVLPGQSHPEQYHKLKEETFVLLYGELELDLDGELQTLGVGDVVTVKPGVHHAFRSESGAVVEEISSTHHCDDSYYVDEAIMANADRKTRLTHWLA